MGPLKCGFTEGFWDGEEIHPSPAEKSPLGH